MKFLSSCTVVECFIIIIVYFRSPIECIQTYYKDYEAGKIIIDIIKGNLSTVEHAIAQLPNYTLYHNYLKFLECDQGDYLMDDHLLSGMKSTICNRTSPQYNRLIGSGSLLGCLETQIMDSILKDKTLRTIWDVKRKHPNVSTGSLSCIVKLNERFFAMTSQHVLSKVNFSGRREVLSQVHHEDEHLMLADIVHLSSSYSGIMGTITVDNTDIAVDIALMPLNQNQLDLTSLKQIELFQSTSNDEVTLLRKRVAKFGAITGMREGKIVNTDCMVPVYINESETKEKGSWQDGEMLAVVGLHKTQKTFAEKGDSGALVTIADKQNPDKRYALGIVTQIRKCFQGHDHAVLCVKLDHCLKALSSTEGLSTKFESSSVELYEGFLRVNASVHDRHVPHMEGEVQGATGGTN